MKNDIKKILVFFLLSIILNPAPYLYAASYSTSGAGEWEDAATWGGAGTPVAGDDGTVNNYVYLNDGLSAAASTLTLTGSGSGKGLLWFDSGTATLTCPTISDSVANSTLQRIEIDPSTTVTIVGDINFLSGSYILLTGGAASTFTFGAAGETHSLVSDILCGGAGNNATLNLLGNVTVTGDITSAKLNTLTINSGTVNFNGFLWATTVNFADDGTLVIASGKNITAAVTTSTANTGTLTFSGTSTCTGAISAGTGIKQINLTGSGTTVTQVGNVQTKGIDLGLNTMAITGTFTQNASGTFATKIDSATSFGKITSSSTSTIPATATVDVTVGGFVSNGSTFTVVDGTGGSAVKANLTVTSSSPVVGFTSNTADDEDLVLTASRNGYDKVVSDTNASAAGVALENAGNNNPAGDMLTVLNTMDQLTTTAQVSDALNTMVPSVDSGVRDTSVMSLNNFVNVARERAENIFKLVRADSARTGFSAGDDKKINSIWGKGYGSYLNQNSRKGIQGYEAWNAGTALGVDRLFADNFVLGVSSGWAYGNVDSDANNGNAYINSAQTAIYTRYRDDAHPYFIDAAGSFAWNWYNGKRDINVGGISRTANAEYDGQQYGVYIGGGYSFDLWENIGFTPLVSLQWNHLYLSSYTETGADALSLSVASQDYDILQSGLGASVSSPLKFKWGTLTPELHGKWLYDFIGDQMVVSSTFTGGGASFEANGFKPARNSFNVGGKLAAALNNDISISGECDTEIKDEFFGVYGAVTLRYAF